MNIRCAIMTALLVLSITSNSHAAEPVTSALPFGLSFGDMRATVQRHAHSAGLREESQPRAGTSGVLYIGRAVEGRTYFMAVFAADGTLQCTSTSYQREPSEAYAMATEIEQKLRHDYGKPHKSLENGMKILSWKTPEGGTASTNITDGGTLTATMGTKRCDALLIR